MQIDPFINLLEDVIDIMQLVGKLRADGGKIMLASGFTLAGNDTLAPWNRNRCSVCAPNMKSALRKTQSIVISQSLE